MDKLKEFSPKGRFWLNICKGAVVALCVAMVLILAFAFIIKWTSLDANVINPINQVIKVISIFFGVAIALKSTEGNNLAKGAIVGALFSALAYLLFSILDGAFIFDMGVIWDLAFSSVIGLISAFIVNYLKK